MSWCKACVYKGADVERIDAKQLKAGFQKACEVLDFHKAEVNALNVFPVPDGDTGTNMSLTMKSAVETVEHAPESIEALAKALGSGSLMGARGNSGVILSQLCRGMAQALKGKEVILLSDIPDVFEASRAKAYKAVMQPTEGTILTIARAMSEFAQKNRGEYDDILLFLKDILRYANHVLQQTPEMLAELKEAGVVDAGGQGLVYLLCGFVESLSGENLEALLEESKAEAPHVETTEEGRDNALKAEKEFFVSFDISDIEEARLLRHLEHYGVLHTIEHTDRGFHVEAYTDTPIKLLNSQDKRGKILEVHVVSTREHAVRKSEEVQVVSEPIRPQEPEKSKEPLRRFGFVAVCMGEGFTSLFKDMMVNEIVSGGQTMNPSTRDLLEAVERVPAQSVFILPNNKNIILAAEQVQELTEKQVYVIPSRSMPEGIMALFNFDDTATAKDNFEQMKSSLSDVVTGQVTYAVRDTEISGLAIHKGDRIGLIGNEIVMTAPEDEQLVLQLVEKYWKPAYTLLTVYVGSDAEESKAEALQKALTQKWPDIEVEFLHGGQPVYPYIFSME